MRTSGVMICVPAYGQFVTAQTMESVYSTGQWLTSQKIRNQLTWYSGADIVEVRNLFLTAWYDGHTDFSHMLFVDSDMGFKPDLIRDMLRFDKPLMGVFYARRQMPPSIVGGALHENHTTADIVSGFLPAAYVGGGVLMISREMVKTLIEKMPSVIDALPSVLAMASTIPLTRLLRAFDPIKQNDYRLSEDVSFCHRWREVGGEVWANVEHSISHVGPFDFHIRYAGMMKRAEEARVAA